MKPLLLFYTDIYRVLRGGCWYHPSLLVPVATRFGGSPGIRYEYRGFRLYLEVR